MRGSVMKIQNCCFFIVVVNAAVACWGADGTKSQKEFSLKVSSQQTNNIGTYKFEKAVTVKTILIDNSTIQYKKGIFFPTVGVVNHVEFYIAKRTPNTYYVGKCEINGESKNKNILLYSLLKDKPMFIFREGSQLFGALESINNMPDTQLVHTFDDTPSGISLQAGYNSIPTLLNYIFSNEKATKKENVRFEFMQSTWYGWAKSKYKHILGLFGLGIAVGAAAYMYQKAK
jgi:hypothetical protein